MSSCGTFSMSREETERADLADLSLVLDSRQVQCLRCSRKGAMKQTGEREFFHVGGKRSSELAVDTK